MFFLLRHSSFGRSRPFSNRRDRHERLLQRRRRAHAEEDGKQRLPSRERLRGFQPRSCPPLNRIAEEYRPKKPRGRGEDSKGDMLGREPSRHCRSRHLKVLPERPKLQR